MPQYKHDIKDTLYSEDVYRMWQCCENNSQRIALALLWISGARVCELTDLKKRDVISDEDFLLMRIKTLKLGKEGRHFSDHRQLQLKRSRGIENSLYIEFIIEYRDKLPNDDSFFIPYSKRWVEIKMAKAGMKALGKPICPMHMRHSRLTHLGSTGKMGMKELQQWKGSKTPASVAGYLASRPFVLNLEGVNDSRKMTIGLTESPVKYISEREIEQSYSQPSETKKHAAEEAIIAQPATQPEPSSPSPILDAPAPAINQPEIAISASALRTEAEQIDKPKPKPVEPTLADLVDTNSS